MDSSSPRGPAEPTNSMNTATDLRGGRSTSSPPGSRRFSPAIVRQVKRSYVRLRAPVAASPHDGGDGPGALRVDGAPNGGALAKDPRRAIMVVDDDHDLRTTIQDELEERGYLVYGAANGMEAINILRQIPPPQLILLDLMMPIMNGWDFLQSVRDDDALSSIPVTVLTWLRHTKIPDSPVLTKPLDLGTLLDVVEQHAARMAG